jgi:MYXO-CTERM domain-containing protein
MHGRGAAAGFAALVSGASDDGRPFSSAQAFRSGEHVGTRNPDLVPAAAALLHPSDDATTQVRVRSCVFLSAAFLLIQVSATHHGTSETGAAAFWFALGAGLLWLVYRRRSRAARAVAVVTSLLGAVMYGASARSAMHTRPSCPSRSGARRFP